MNAMTAIKHLESSSFGSRVTGVTGVVVDAGVGFGVSYGLGQWYHRHHDKWYGKQAPRILAGVGKLGAVACAAFGAPDLMTGLINSVGQAGINAIGLEMGLSHARKKTGVKPILVPDSSDISRIPGAVAAEIGALGRSRPSRGLSWAQVEEIASGH